MSSGVMDFILSTCLPVYLSTLPVSRCLDTQNKILTPNVIIITLPTRLAHTRKLGGMCLCASAPMTASSDCHDQDASHAPKTNAPFSAALGAVPTVPPKISAAKYAIVAGFNNVSPSSAKYVCPMFARIALPCSAL